MVWLFATPWDCNLPGSSVHGIPPGKNTGVGCHALPQGVFLTQGSKLRLLWLLHCRQTLYHWATREALEWYWPHWIREMRGSYWISSQNIRFISIWRTDVFKILISPRIWSCLFSGPGKQHLFSIFSVSSQHLDNLWILSGRWAETTCHYHPIRSGVLTTCSSSGRSGECIYTPSTVCFQIKYVRRKQRPFLVCFALWSPVRWWAGHSTWMHSVPPPPLPSPGPTENPWPLNHAFQTFSIITVHFNIPIHYTHTHVRRWESKYLTSGGAKRLTHQNLVLKRSQAWKPPAVPEVNPFVAESERGCGEKVSQGSRRRTWSGNSCPPTSRNAFEYFNNGYSCNAECQLNLSFAYIYTYLKQKFVKQYLAFLLWHSLMLFCFILFCSTSPQPILLLKKVLTQSF